MLIPSLVYSEWLNEHEGKQLNVHSRKQQLGCPLTCMRVEYLFMPVIGSLPKRVINEELSVETDPFYMHAWSLSTRTPHLRHIYILTTSIHNAS
jgi:hypothetical protein